MDDIRNTIKKYISIIGGYTAILSLAVLLILLILAIIGRLLPERFNAFALFIFADDVFQVENFILVFVTIFLAGTISIIGSSEKLITEFRDKIKIIEQTLGKVVPLDNIAQVYPEIQKSVIEYNNLYGNSFHEEKLITVVALSGRTNAENFIPWHKDQSLLDGWKIVIYVPDDLAMKPSYIPSIWPQTRRDAIRQLKEEIDPSKTVIEIKETDHVPFIHGFKLGKSRPAYWVSFLRWRDVSQEFRSDAMDPYEIAMPNSKSIPSEIRRQMFEVWLKKISM
ncbi:MAG: hypothetical protein AAF228_03525 [Pseudomonadota bacterium]